MADPTPTTIAAPGLTSDWLNGWLAAVGITLLVPEVRLAWTNGPNPHALFSAHTASDLEQFGCLVADHLPSVDRLRELRIAESLPGQNALPRKVTAAAFRERCRLSRDGDCTLGWITTDLAPANNDGSLQTSPFYPAGPGTVGTLHDRLVACGELITDPAAMVTASLAGTAVRQKRFGLGFDYRRIASPTTPNGDNWIDPVVEVLSFHALALHPVRGDGRVSARPDRVRASTRGWGAPASRRGAYNWPVWSPLLDVVGIDALLDQFWADPTRALGATAGPVTGAHQLVPYRPLGTADTTRGYGSEAFVVDKR